jgi:hypothetical protein
MRCCQNKTSFSWSYRQKGHWKKMLYQGGEREKYTHFRWVDMCKWQRVIPRHKASPRYGIAHGWKKRMDLLNLKPWMHFREPGSSLYAYSYFFLFLIFLLLFFLSFIHSFFSCHSFGFFFLWDFHLENHVHRLWIFFQCFLKILPFEL